MADNDTTTEGGTVVRDREGAETAGRVADWGSHTAEAQPGLLS